MGSPPQVRARAGAVLSMTVVSLALGSALGAVLLAPLLVRAEDSGEWSGVTDPFSSEEGDEDIYELCCELRPGICIFPYPPPCTRKICESCCPPDGNKHPPCNRAPPENPFYLVAQIALGAALVVAITALVSIVLRTCKGRRRRSEERPQFRPAGASATSLDVYVQDRMHDCPPCYDEISWEKPPSYANLPVIEAAAEAPDRLELPSSAPSDADPSEPPGAASPPPYPGVVFTISQRVEQPTPTPPAEAGAARAPGSETAKEVAPAAAAGRPSADA